MSMPQKTIGGRQENLPLASQWRESLESPMRKLRGEVMRLLWLRALSMAVIAVVLVTLTAAALDWWWRPSSSLGRWGLSGALVAALGGVLWWFIWSTPWRRVSLVAVARRLERLIPSLDDRLSSAVALLEGAGHSGPLSATDLTDGAVRQAAADLEAARPERAIARGPAWRMALFAAAIVFAFVAICWWRPSIASLAARRLVAPGNQVTWPQRHQLRLLNVPQLVHRGTDVEVFVHDERGQLPSDTEVLVRNSQGNVSSPVLRMSGDAAAAGIERVMDDFDIRARGGDDNTMAWRSVRVTTAPTIESYRVRLRPPEYSGREPQTLVGARMRVLAGTQMWIDATVAPPIAQARFVRVEGGAPPASGEPSDQASSPVEAPTSWPVSIGDDGRSIAVGPLVLDRDSRFTFRWVDADGLAGESHEQWRVEVVEDAVPRVAITEPEADLEITPTGSIVLALTAEDDLGLAEAWFEVHGGPASSHVTRLQVERYRDSPQEVTKRTRLRIEDLHSDDGSGDGSDDGSDDGSGGSPQLPPAPGHSLEVTGVAIDIGGGRGESTTRRLRIVSPDKLQQNLARNQRAATEQLREAAREQAIAAEQTEAARGRLFGDAEQTAAAEDHLRAADSAQATVERRLEDGSQSALEQLRSALQTARENQLDTASLEQLLEQIEAITEKNVRPAGDQLDRSRQAFAAGDEEAAGELMDGAVEAQRQAAQRLSDVVDTVQRQNARRAAIEQLAELAATQSRLEEASRDVANAADPRSEASRLAQRQRELARDAEALAQGLQQLAEEMEQQDSQVAEAAEAAAETLQRGAAESRSGRRGAAADAMRAAAAEMERGREGRAAEMQSAVVEQLAAARRQLSGEMPAEDDASSEPPAQRFAARVEKLRADQESVVEALRNEPAPAIAGVQRELADRADQVSADATAPPGFPEAIGDVAATMRTAAALLRRRGSEAAAVDQAEAAVERLRFIAASLQETRESPADEVPERESPEDGDQAQQEMPQEEPEAMPLATLRLVRATQDFLRRRTEQIAAAERSAEDADPLRRAQTEATKRALADEQARLIQRIEQYARQSAAAQASPPEESDATRE